MIITGLPVMYPGCQGLVRSFENNKIHTKNERLRQQKIKQIKRNQINKLTEKTRKNKQRKINIIKRHRKTQRSENEYEKKTKTRMSN